MNGLNYINKKGAVSFFSDKKGNIFQQIDDCTPFPVSAELRYVGAKNGYTIKYNSDGVSGYCIFFGDTLVAKDIWTLREADDLVISF